MSVVIGIGVSLSVLRFVAVRRNKVVWTSSVPRVREESMAPLLARTLATRPAVARRSARLVATVDVAESQLRPLGDLPDVRALGDLHAMIAMNTDRFFLGGGQHLRVSAPRASSTGETWAAAVDGAVVEQLAEACRAANVRFTGALPVSAALRHVLAANPDDGSAEATWVSDGTRLRVTYQGPAPVSVLRERCEPSTASGLHAHATFPDGIDVANADAWAATHVRAGGDFLIGKHSQAFVAGRRRAARMRVWILLAACCVLIAGWAPGALALRQARDARARADMARRNGTRVQVVRQELATATTELNVVARFEASRRSTTLLLAELAMALPESTAITAFRLDSAGGSLSVLTPRAAASIDAIASVPGIRRVQAAGPMTREVTSGIELERATLRFSFDAPPPRPNGGTR